MAQIGRASGARPGPVEVLCASVQEPSGMANAVCMAAIALVQGPRTGLRVLSLPRLRTGSTLRRSEQRLGALPSKVATCGLSCRKLKIGSWTAVICPRTGAKIGNSKALIVGSWD